MNVWDEVLARVRATVDAEDFRRWFDSTAYASDAGDQITVWVPTEVIRRHLMTHFQDRIDLALNAVGRSDTVVRFVVAGVSDDGDEDE
jgi:chromosomal replication initiation ATPase DnaA